MLKDSNKCCFSNLPTPAEELLRHLNITAIMASCQESLAQLLSTPNPPRINEKSIGLQTKKTSSHWRSSFQIRDPCSLWGCSLPSIFPIRQIGAEPPLPNPPPLDTTGPGCRSGSWWANWQPLRKTLSITIRALAALPPSNSLMDDARRASLWDPRWLAAVLLAVFPQSVY